MSKPYLPKGVQINRLSLNALLRKSGSSVGRNQSPSKIFLTCTPRTNIFVIPVAFKSAPPQLSPVESGTSTFALDLLQIGRRQENIASARIIAPGRPMHQWESVLLMFSYCKESILELIVFMSVSA